MSRKITVAKEIGFCGGVRRSIQIVEDTLAKHNKVQVFGQLVHNGAVTNELETQGVLFRNSIRMLDKVIPVVLKAHGTTPALIQKLHKKGFQVIDSTCPLVKDIHDAVKAFKQEKRTIIIVGDRGHDEVIGIAGQVHRCIVISNVVEAAKLKSLKRAGVVVQSTQFVDDAEHIISILAQRVKDLRFINTICEPSRRRQLEIWELTRTNDVIIVVGSLTSANTKRLLKIARKVNPLAFLVQSAEELQSDWFIEKKSVAIASGTSTPDSAITEVVQKIEKMP
jgi:4-hydroxy-3-methylbut-2-enyl diphosphate reductase